MPDQSIAGPGVSAANIFFFIAIGIGLILVNVFAGAALRHFVQKRRLQQAQANGYDNVDMANFMDESYAYRMGFAGNGTYPYSLGANGSRRGRMARRKKQLKLMTREQIDAKFPVKPFSLAKKESSLYSRKPQSQEVGEKVPDTSVCTASQDAVVDKHYANPSHSSETLEKPNQLQKINSHRHQRNNSLGVKPKHKSLVFSKEPRRSFIDSLRALGSESSSVNSNTKQNSSNQDQSDYAKFIQQSNTNPRYSTPVFGSNFYRHGNDSRSLASDVEDDSEDEHVITPVTENDLLTCAICIEDMVDEELVRGLTCGHIFHAGCIEPWLLTRRACCPLCKHDFYAPKPIDPLGPEPNEEVASPRRASRRSTTNENQRRGNTTTTIVEVIGESERPEPQGLHHFRSTASLASSMFSRSRVFNSGRGNSRNQSNTNVASEDTNIPANQPGSRIQLSTTHQYPDADTNTTPQQLEEGSSRFARPALAVIR